MGKNVGSFDLQVLPANATAKTIVEADRRYRAALRRKWAKWLGPWERAGLPEVPERLKDSMAMLFENQQWATATRAEATLTTDVTLPDKYTLPIIRKVFPHLWVNRVASMQTLPRSSGGTGKVFFQDFQREDGGNTSLTSADSDYASSSEGAVPKRVKMVITSDTLTATKDLLAATWSTELQEDLMGTLGLDAERELIDAASNEILREIEHRVIADMLANATAGDASWSYTVPPPDEGYYTAPEYYKTLGHAFIDAEMYILKKRFRKADWVLVGYDLYSYIQKMEDFTSLVNDNPGFDSPVQVGVKREGTFGGRWDIYTSEYMTSTKGLMGVYPRSQLDTGYIVAPYIPLGAMPLVYASYSGPDEDDAGTYKNTDEWTRQVRTRWAKKSVVGDLFSTITISA
jgi:hypothetical protein